METGRKIGTVCGIYMVVKSLINLILGFGLNNIIMLVVSAFLGYMLYRGSKYFNYVTAAFLVILFLANIVVNIKGHHWFYLTEGIIDVIFSYIMVSGKHVREYYLKN